MGGRAALAYHQGASCGQAARKMRVYAEAGTQKDADELCARAPAAVYGICGGLGEAPMGAQTVTNWL